MSFKEVIIKNFFGSIRQYISFFLCNTFTIVIFFLYSTLIFNENIISKQNEEMFQYVLTTTVAGITIFSVFFILYANRAFIKGRYKELGVYMTLGMSNEQVRRLINIQNEIISVISLFIGMGVGALLSRLFQMVVISILELEDITYMLTYKSFITTIFAFGLIFGIVYIRTNVTMRHMDITSLLREGRKKEHVRDSKWNLFLTISGAILFVAAIVFEVIAAKNENVRSNQFVMMAFICMLFVSIYLLISKGGEYVLQAIKCTEYYSRNMLWISEFSHKFQQNKRILFVLSILSTLTIMFVASPLTLFKLSETIAEMMPNNLEYVETATVNSDYEQISSFVDEESIDHTVDLEFVYLYADQNQQMTNAYPILPAKSYYQMTGESISIQQGECINYVVEWYPGSQGLDAGSEIHLLGVNNEYQFTVTSYSHVTNFVSKTFPCNSVLVVNDQDFEMLYRENKSSTWGCYHIVNYVNWKDTKEIVDKIDLLVGTDEFPVNATIKQYEMLKKSYGTFLFLSIVLAVLFFVAGGTVLYFRQMNGLSESKAVFDKLNKIGISSKQRNHIIGRQLRIIFFLPVFFGAIASVCLICYITNLFNGMNIVKDFMLITGKVIIVYTISQAAFYILTQRKYSRNI